MLDWSKLPSVVVVEILTYLSRKDRLLSSSVCTSWRKCLFCACHWRDFVLRITIDGTTENRLRTKCLVEKIGKFVREVVIYFDSSVPTNVNLTAQVLETIAKNPNLQYVKLCPTSGRLEHTESSAVIRYVDALKTIITKSRKLKGIAFGCVEEIVDNADQFLQLFRKHQSHTLRHLYLASVKENPECYKLLDLSPAMFADFISLQSLSIDYDYLSEDLLENLSRSDHVPLLRLDIHVHGSSLNGRKRPISDAVWKKLGDHCPSLEISLTLLHSTQATHQLMDILRPSMRLARFSQYFCATINVTAIYFIAYTFVKSFRSICIIDSMEHFNADLYDAQEEDPFVMLAWRCENLLEFTLIGYKIAMDDLIAIVRLRSAKLKLFKIPDCCIEYSYDSVADYDVLCHEVSDLLDQTWSPIANEDLHPALIDWQTDAVGMYITQIFSQQMW
ncbi:hypothetical protein CHUAL_000604 [Chamberlinius hualienensis]